MQAAILLGGSNSRLERVSLPAIGPKEVLVRLEGTGVCASNLPAWEGRPWFDYPLDPGAPGHEGWGTVEAVGQEVTTVGLGTRVALVSSQAFAEYDVTDERALVPVPSALDGMPIPGEPLACAVNAHGRAAITPGSWVVIIGIGFLGAVLTRLATLQGGRVIAVSRRAFARTLAQRFGAEASVSFDDPMQSFGEIHARLGDALAPVVIEAVGTQAALDLATRVAGTRGRLVIAGYHQDGPRAVDLQQWNWKGLDVINAHERQLERYTAGMRTGIELLADGSLDLASLLSAPIPLSQLDEAFRLAVERPDGFVKAIVDLRTR
ncbi:MAG: zinc-binding dehydrogenase [Acidobacteria bacterium]|nr:zinc-binding dehydrogenase [Acidobacteriota bacterium]